MLSSMRFHAQFRGGRSVVHNALGRFAEKCEAHSIPYAVMGGLAVQAHGDHDRVTHGVDVLMTRQGLETFQKNAMGQGWKHKLPNSKRMIDTVLDVPIDVIISGDIPGSGRAEDCPLTFPDPSDELLSLHGDGFVISLSRLIELKLAAGITGGRIRMKDFVDVQALIRWNSLPLDFGETLHPFVQNQFKEEWNAVMSDRN